MLARRKISAVDLLGDLVELGLGWILVVEGQRHDRIGKLTALPLIELLYSLEDVGEDPVVVSGLAFGRQDLVLPLRPSTAVDE